eukprot:GILK01008487.1.p1 GENE.GILK01008487.1~~GILK01008487.1.p1  ORF type:complete len:486 (+),score=77.23 GILK01008487.1:48-1460(+)
MANDLSSELETKLHVNEEDSSASSSVTGLLYDKAMLKHEGPSSHPERPARLSSIWQRFEEQGLVNRCKRIPCRDVTQDELHSVHPDSHIEKIEETAWDTVLGDDTAPKVPRGKGHRFTFGTDTYDNAHSAAAARLAAGGVVEMTLRVARGELQNGYALVRPPGHHASSTCASGFCLYNNVAVAAKVAQQVAGVGKILILDWDVHHGNGTQAIFEEDPSVLYISLHRHDKGTFYPCSGAASECGTGAGQGFSVNIPWNQRGLGDRDYVCAFESIVMPIARQFKPELVLISAGYDAARGDPLGGMEVTPAGYAYMTQSLMQLAGGRVVVALEGGYNLGAISDAAEATLRVLLGELMPLSSFRMPPFEILQKSKPTKPGRETITTVLNVQKRFWNDLPVAAYDRTGSYLDSALLPPDSSEDEVHLRSPSSSSVSDQVSDQRSESIDSSVDVLAKELDAVSLDRASKESSHEPN